MSVADTIYDKLKSAPPAMVAEVLDFVEFLEARAKKTVAPTETGPKVDWQDFFGVWSDKEPVTAIVQSAVADRDVVTAFDIDRGSILCVLGQPVFPEEKVLGFGPQDVEVFQHNVSGWNITRVAGCPDLDDAAGRGGEVESARR